MSIHAAVHRAAFLESRALLEHVHDHAVQALHICDFNALYCAAVCVLSSSLRVEWCLIQDHIIARDLKHNRIRLAGEILVIQLLCLGQIFSLNIELFLLVLLYGVALHQLCVYVFWHLHSYRVLARNRVYEPWSYAIGLIQRLESLICKRFTPLNNRGYQLERSVFGVGVAPLLNIYDAGYLIESVVYVIEQRLELLRVRLL